MGWGYSYPKKKPSDPAKMLEKLKKKKPDINPVCIEGTKIAKTWWGISWNKNLERYADYESRIGRGRSYVKNGRVLDLQIFPGLITALVAGSGSKPYEISIEIELLSEAKWKDITSACKNLIGSLSELVEGRFPEESAELFFSLNGGLFPTPKEIHLSCTCPDWADMCKHVAAALYGVGARLDTDPLLFFVLRGVDFEELLKRSVEDKVKSLLLNAGSVTSRTISDQTIYDIFGDLL